MIIPTRGAFYDANRMPGLLEMPWGSPGLICCLHACWESWKRKLGTCRRGLRSFVGPDKHSMWAHNLWAGRVEERMECARSCVSM